MVGDSVDVPVEGPWCGPGRTVVAAAVTGELGVEGS